ETSGTSVPLSGSITLGDKVHDTSTVSGTPPAFTLGGSVSYTFFTNATCAGGGTAAGGGSLAGGAAPHSPSKGPLTPGSYAFQATYSGDGNYTGSASVCEPFTVGTGTSTTSTSVYDETSQASVPLNGSVTLGDTVHDTSTI